MSISFDAIKINGQFYETTAPDTLDLTDRARLALNVLTANPDPRNSYRLWQSMQFNTSPPHLSGPNWLTYKFLESLPMMRVMCGDNFNLGSERDMMQAHLDRIADDGLVYEPPGTSSFMRDEGASPFTNGRFILAMLAWHQRDGVDAWLDRVDRMNRALATIAVYRRNYAFHPPEAVYAPNIGWLYTHRSGTAFFPYMPPDEPSRDQQGIEGTIKENAHVLRAAVRWYEISGDPEALDYARKLANFFLLPSFWEDGAAEGIVGYEHGLFAGHFHGNTGGLRALLRLAIVTRDESLKQFVRESYEFALRSGLPRIGWFPTWLCPERFGRSPFLRTVCEGCGIADMVALAIKLSDAGVRDCWDDVDQYVRNQLVEQQGIDPELLQAASRHGQPFVSHSATTSTVRVLERSLGAFSGFGEPTCLPHADFHGCCTGNGTQALYYAWEAISRFQDGTAQINLLLNRAAPWVDIDSYLPFQGKVVVHNKQASALSIRIPGWVDRGGLSCSVSSRPVTPYWAGNYVLLTGLRPRDHVTLEFRVPEEAATYTAAGVTYHCTFRGSTLVDVAPRNIVSGSYPLYRREVLRSPLAAMKTKQRYVADAAIRW